MPKSSRLTDLYRAVAEKTLAETLRLKEGETVTIETWTSGLPLAAELSLAAKELGAFPLTIHEDEEGYVEGIRRAPKGAVGKMGRHEYGLIANSDAYVFIPGPPIGGYYPKITRKEFIDSTGYNSSWYEAAKKSGLRGARLTAGYIGPDLAKLLGKPRDEVVSHQLRAAGVDLEAVQAKAKELSKVLKDGAEMVITTDAGELKMKLKGDIEVQDGVADEKDVAEGNNMAYVPPGYISKDVDTGSVSGAVSFGPSVTRFGLIEDLQMMFVDGAFSGWGSRRSAPALRALQDVLPEKSRVPSYILIGLNPLMKYGYGQDRFPEGSLTVGVGVSGIVRRADMTVDGKAVIKDGRLVG